MIKSIFAFFQRLWAFMWLTSRRLFIVLWFLLMFIVGVWIFVENKTLVTVNLFGLWQSEQSLGAVICTMLALGGVLGFFSSLLSAKTSLYWQKRKYAKATHEIQKLKHAQARE